MIVATRLLEKYHNGEKSESMEGPHRKLAAIMIADVVGYSRLMGADEEGALDPELIGEVLDGLDAGNVALKTPVYDWGYSGQFGDGFDGLGIGSHGAVAPFNQALRSAALRGRGRRRAAGLSDGQRRHAAIAVACVVGWAACLCRERRDADASELLSETDAPLPGDQHGRRGVAPGQTGAGPRQAHR